VLRESPMKSRMHPEDKDGPAHRPPSQESTFGR
jgi:hypothetical protein